MFSTLKKILHISAYIALIVVCVIFSVENRAKVDLSLFPLPYTLSMPLFLFAIFIFLMGMILGWIVTRFEIFKITREHKAANKRVAAMENELKASRAERLIK